VLRRFLVEAYTAADSAVDDVEDHARRAAAQLTEAGTSVRFVRPIFVPADETCFYLLDAPSADAAAAAIERAGVSPQRVTEVARAYTQREEER
jgi:hypothetical protein